MTFFSTTSSHRMTCSDLPRHEARAAAKANQKFDSPEDAPEVTGNKVPQETAGNAEAERFFGGVGDLFLKSSKGLGLSIFDDV